MTPAKLDKQVAEVYGQHDEDEVVSMGYSPRPWQEQQRAQFKRWNVLVIHRRGGKTVLSLATLCDAALRTKKVDARYGYIAPLRHQAKSVAWDYLKAFATRIPGTVVNEAELYVQFFNGSRVKLFGADNPDSMRGLYFDGVVIDEVADMKPQTWTEVLRPALSDRRGWALFIGTPKGVNLFSKLYYYAVDHPDWHAAKLTVYDTDTLDPKEIAAARESMSERQFAQEFLCDFDAANDDQLIPLEAVLAAQKRAAPPHNELARYPIILGVDVARFGGDTTVIAARQGPVLHELTHLKGLDNMEVAARVANACAQLAPSALFIDAGRGEGVIDRLRMELGYRPVGVDFGGKAERPYLRKRDEIWGKMADWVKECAVLPVDQKLQEALCAPTYNWNNPKHLMQIESKRQMRSRGLSSPDPGDAVALTFSYPVPMLGQDIAVHLPGAPPPVGSGPIGRYPTRADRMGQQNGSPAFSGRPGRGIMPNDFGGYM